MVRRTLFSRSGPGRPLPSAFPRGSSARRWAAGLATGALCASLAASNEARACGGCFGLGVGSQTETTVVTGHRMVLAVSTTQSVLWDQFRYSGSPSEFAWILPVRRGARIELATDAWFDTLDASTAVQVTSPPLSCPSPPRGGCWGGSSSADSAGGMVASAPVTVLHEGSVGPYETVTLETKVPGALNDWLVSHGYAVQNDIQPVIDAYVQEGFDFIALRLLPGKGVRQMKPVRVVSPGAGPVLPLRMVAAGTGPQVAITLFVIGEGRWETKNFPNAMVPREQLSWDFTTSQSNYAVLRQAALAANGGVTWITAFAQRGALLGPIGNPARQAYYGETITIARTYFGEASKTGEAPGGASCASTIAQANADVNSSATVVSGCAPDCAATELDALSLACGGADDLAVALTGMHPADVWLTRLESNLPHAALATDLELQAAAQQAAVTNSLSPAILVGQQDECRILTEKAAAKFSTPPGAGAGTLSLAALAAALRRFSRTRRRGPSASRSESG